MTTPDYFATMGTSILRGRGLRPDDGAGSPLVAVVSQAMARILWPTQDAVGQCIRLEADTAPCTRVVGVAEDAAQRSLTDDARLQFYLPIDQYRPASGFALLLRVHASPASQSEPIRRVLQRIMPGQDYVTTMPLSQRVDEERAPWRFGATMFLAFGLLALVVAGIGVYALIAYGVAQRMHELGVRVALGAQAADVVRLWLARESRMRWSACWRAARSPSSPRDGCSRCYSRNRRVTRRCSAQSACYCSR